MTIYCGIDWADRHHDVAIVNDAGTVLATRRVGESAAGVTALLMMLADQAAADAGVEAEEFVAVDVAIETGRGLLVSAVRAAGHRVYEINPKASSRYRDRYAVSGSKSDAGDALVLAHLLRTDRDRHRPMPADSEQVQTLGVLARAQQDAVWTVLRDAGRLRAVLWEFYPAALQAFPNLHIASAVTVLAARRPRAQQPDCPRLSWANCCTPPATTRRATCQQGCVRSSPLSSCASRQRWRRRWGRS
jgi:transposase